jgi:hypothetical protein
MPENSAKLVGDDHLQVGHQAGVVSGPA